MSKKVRDLELTAIKNYLLPYLNLEKRHPFLPGASTLKGHASLIGIDEAELSELRNGYKKTVKKTALDLLDNQDTIDSLTELPFKSDDSIMLIGDSLSDDLQGWFEILDVILNVGIDEARFKMINRAVYGNTSLDALRQADRNLEVYKPDWVIVALGSLDAQRLHASPNRNLVSMAEFFENISSLEQMISEVTPNPIIWLTPPPVIEELMVDMPLFEGSIRESDLNQYREIIGGKSGFVIDPYGRRMGSPNADAWNYLPDGFHLSLSGHTVTVQWILRTLSTQTS